MSNNTSNDSPSDIIIRAIMESDNPNKSAETAIMAICSFLSRQGHTRRVPSVDLPERDLSVAG